jgi:hypothetical protein
MGTAAPYRGWDKGWEVAGAVAVGAPVELGAALLAGGAGSVAARTVKADVRDSAAKVVVNSQRRGVDLNIVQ